MTPKQRVLKKYRRAICERDIVANPEWPYSVWRGGYYWLGGGKSAASAWADAARRLERKHD